MHSVFVFLFTLRFSFRSYSYTASYSKIIPIAKELSSRLNYLPISTASALALGAVASFNLVYPSPVIISAAEELSVNRNTFILLGFLISVPTSLAGYLYARQLEKNAVSRNFENNTQGQSVKNVVQRMGDKKPGGFEAYAPIFLPLFLTLFQAGFDHPHPVLAFLGNPDVIL